MRKNTIILIGFLLLGVRLHAQITPLQEAVDFTATDVYGNEIHLFDILDNGQAVFIHFFLTYNFDPPLMPFMTAAYNIMGCNQHDVCFMEIAHRENNSDAMGQLMETVDCKEGSNDIPIDRYPNGLYFVHSRQGKVGYFIVNH